MSEMRLVALHCMGGVLVFAALLIIKVIVLENLGMWWYETSANALPLGGNLALTATYFVTIVSF